MAQKSIGVDFVKSFAGKIDPTTGVAGADKVVRGTAILIVPDEIVDFFNIPALPPAQAIIQVVKVKGFTYSKYNGFADTTGKAVSVSDFERLATIAQSSRNSVALELEGKETTRGKLRVTSIRFPRFFTLPMISQAIGSMIKAHEPTKFKVSRTGKSYPLILNTSSDLLPGRSTGAWVSQSVEASTNADETTAPDAPVVETKTPRGKK